MAQKKAKQEQPSNREAHKAARTTANKVFREARQVRQQQQKLARKITPRGTARAKRRLGLQPEGVHSVAARDASIAAVKTAEAQQEAA